MGSGARAWARARAWAGAWAGACAGACAGAWAGACASGAWAKCYKTFYVRNLFLSLIRYSVCSCQAFSA